MPAHWQHWLSPLLLCWQRRSPVSGDAGSLAALVVTAIIMLATKKPLPAIAAGIASAGLVRYLGITAL